MRRRMWSALGNLMEFSCSPGIAGGSTQRPAPWPGGSYASWMRQGAIWLWRNCRLWVRRGHRDYYHKAAKADPKKLSRSNETARFSIADKRTKDDLADMHAQTGGLSSDPGEWSLQGHGRCSGAAEALARTRLRPPPPTASWRRRQRGFWKIERNILRQDCKRYFPAKIRNGAPEQ